MIVVIHKQLYIFHREALSIVNLTKSSRLLKSSRNRIRQRYT